VNEAAELIIKTVHPEANIIFGAVIDETMEDKIRITVIATGFDTAGQRRPVVLRPAMAVPASTKVVAPRAVPMPAEFPARILEPDNLDVPAFLRHSR